MGRNVPVLWDVVEEHLDEAAFLYAMWELALRSPLRTLASIAEGPEERLLAHLDALRIAGPAVEQELLLPALAADEAGLAFAAAFTLLSGERDALGEVLDALAGAEPPARDGIRRALSVVPRAGLGDRLAAVAPKAPATLQGDLLDVLAYVRVDPGLRLEPLAAAGGADEARAIRTARVFPARLDPAVVARALTSADAALRAEALETAAVTGIPGAGAACEATLAEHGPACGTAALLVAVSGEQDAVPTLVGALAAPGLRREAAFALGFTGCIAAADALLEAMADEKLAPVAAEGFAAITGLAMERDVVKRRRAWTPGAADDDDELRGPDADLPVPDRDAVARWWRERRPSLHPSERWLRGEAWTPHRLLRELSDGPARRRAALSLEAAVRTRGQVRIAWDALSARQRREIAEAAGARIATRGAPDRTRSAAGG